MFDVTSELAGAKITLNVVVNDSLFMSSYVDVVIPFGRVVLASPSFYYETAEIFVKQILFGAMADNKPILIGHNFPIGE